MSEDLGARFPSPKATQKSECGGGVTEKEIIKKKQRSDVHPYIPELKELYRAGRCTRRKFLRTATLLGVSFASASAAGPSYRFPRQRIEDEVAARVMEYAERISRAWIHSDW